MVYKFLTLCLLATTVFALPFNDDMVGTQPKTGQIMRGEPKDSIPIGGNARYVVPPEETLTLTNPTKNPTAVQLQRGKRLYKANCTQCHGIFQDGNYHPGAVQPWIMGLDLSTADMAAKPDGHFFGSIHYGFPQVGEVKVMNSYAYKFSIEEHWDIVSFIRSMQAERRK